MREKIKNERKLRRGEKKERQIEKKMLLLDYIMGPCCFDNITYISEPNISPLF